MIPGCGVLGKGKLIRKGQVLRMYSLKINILNFFFLFFCVNNMIEIQNKTLQDLAIDCLSPFHIFVDGKML